MRIFSSVTVCILLLGSLSRAAGKDATQIKVYVGNASSPEVGETLTVKHHASSLRFELQPHTIRYRYKLEGLDDDWVTQPGEMKLVVRFLNEDRDQIHQYFYAAKEESKGWNGMVKSSGFTNRREELVVPEGAESIYLGISSSGPPETVGFYALTGLTVGSPSLGETRLFPTAADPTPGAKGSIWTRSGTHPSMASSLVLGEDDDKFRVLITKDDDILAHADWALRLEHHPKVKPGETLTIQWREAYSVGTGDLITAQYDRIPPGNYRFVVEGLDLAGRPQGQIYTMDLNVTQPLWRNLWFWAVTLVAVATLSGMWGRHLARKRSNREQRHTQLIAEERLRIARDLHDDLGTRLSHINLLSSHAQSTSSDGEAGETFQQVTLMSRELIGSLSETVWMLNPDNGDLESLVNYLCRLVGELCKLAEIRCRIDALSVDETMPVSHEFRHNISLSVKETVNNVLKHASASEIKMKISKRGPLLKIVITDNGVGIDPNPNKTGSGIHNVAQRMAAIGGRSTLRQLPESGVEVILEAPIHTRATPDPI